MCACLSHEIFFAKQLVFDFSHLQASKEHDVGSRLPFGAGAAGPVAELRPPAPDGVGRLAAEDTLDANSALKGVPCAETTRNSG